MALLASGGGRLARPAAPHDLDARLEAAGRPGGLGAREVMGVKVAAATLGAGWGLLAAGAAPGRLGPLVMAVAPAAGFLAPDLWLARVARERARRARRELPAMLDLLRVSVEAGRSPAGALAEVGSERQGPLAAEWRAVGAQVALGVPLARALERSAARLPIPEVQSLVAAVVRATRHGAPLAAVLGAQASDARSSLTRHVREEAARAGPKIQLVVALLLVPSVLLLVAAALAAALLDGGGGGVSGF